jgi:hypothetical protein
VTNEDFYIITTLLGLLILIVGFMLLNEKMNRKLENDERIINRLDLLINNKGKDRTDVVEVKKNDQFYG